MTKKSVTARIMELETMEMPELRRAFQDVFGYETKCDRADAIRRRLAYRIQEIEFGGLDKQDEEALKRIADNDPAANGKGMPRSSKKLLPGTRLFREYKGKRYVVTVAPKSGYEFEGRPYRSLSAIATEITGTHWNGKLFFGVK